MAEPSTRLKWLLRFDAGIAVFYIIYYIAVYIIMQTNDLEGYFGNWQLTASMIAMVSLGFIAIKRNTQESVTLALYLVTTWLIGISIVYSIFYGLMDMPWASFDNILASVLIVLNIGILAWDRMFPLGLLIQSMELKQFSYTR